MAAPKAALKIEARLAALEAEVEQLKQKIEGPKPEPKPWWESIVGAFADDPDFLEAMRLGREYRESLRPKPAKSAKSAKTAKAKKRSNVRA
jgi:hypothetical protein